LLLEQIGQPDCDVLICPPATLIARMHDLAIGSELLIGAQDCHEKNAGAHTGDISAEMLADAGATHVILGHSERRADHGETDALVAAKARAVFGRGLVAIVCVGETEAQRDAGETLAVVEAQLAASLPDDCVAAYTVVAYEPIWAIGTGRTPSLDDIGAVHAAIRANLTTRFGAEGASMRLLYGGSVKPDNAARIFEVADVDGALVGGASLKASDFAQIVQALKA
jgi:triosephosphate isomerase